MFHKLRGTEPTLFDVMGDNGRLLAIRAGKATVPADLVEELWEYIEAVADDRSNYKGEIRELFPEGSLGKAELFSLGVLVDFYETQVRKLKLSPI